MHIHVMRPYIALCAMARAYKPSAMDIFLSIPESIIHVEFNSKSLYDD